ncbi:MAG: hypothetical protein ABFS17_11240 [Chloroflexota bacterium]
MEIVFLVVAMILVGLLVAALAPKIFKGEAPYGIRADYIASVIAAVVVGFLDWYLIPMIIDSESLKYLGVALEPGLSSLLVLWLMRKAKS